jgi:hypothetical protein
MIEVPIPLVPVDAESVKLEGKNMRSQTDHGFEIAAIRDPG